MRRIFPLSAKSTTLSTYYAYCALVTDETHQICALKAKGRAASGPSLRRIRLFSAGRVLACVLLGWLWMAMPALGQFHKIRTPEQLNTAHVINLFASWEGQRPIHGVLIDLPAGWQFEEAIAFNENLMESVPLRIQRIRGRRFQAEAPYALQGPHEFILKVKTGSTAGIQTWSVTPFTILTTQNREVVQRFEGARIDQVVHLKPESLGAGTHVLQLSSDVAEPLLLRRQTLPDLNGASSFTIEFWLQTVQLNSIVLSSWNGDEQQSYPFEFVVDGHGYLVCYQGRPGRHQPLTASQPIADGMWHHVALTYQPGEMTLFLDGSRVDALALKNTSPMFNRLPIAVGSRVGLADQSRILPFEGLIDEVRFWNRYQTAAAIERTMHLPLKSATPNRIVLNFEEPLSHTLTFNSPNRWVSTPAALPLFYPISRLRGRPIEGAVQLQWQTQAQQVQSFEIQRSIDGKTFETIHTFEPIATPTSSFSQYAEVFTYIDPDISSDAGVCFYRIQQHFSDGNQLVSKTIKISTIQEIPTTISLIGNSPNPFSTSTFISFEVKKPEHVLLSVWDVSGHQVALLVSEEMQPGIHQVAFEAGDLTSGTYFVSLQTRKDIQTGKMLLMK